MAERTHPLKTTGAGGLRHGWDVRSRSFGGGDIVAPIPRQQFVDAFCRMIRQSGEHVGEPSLRVDIVELGGYASAEDHRGRRFEARGGMSAHAALAAAILWRQFQGSSSLMRLAG